MPFDRYAGRVVLNNFLPGQQHFPRAPGRQMALKGSHHPCRCSGWGKPRCRQGSAARAALPASTKTTRPAVPLPSNTKGNAPRTVWREQALDGGVGGDPQAKLGFSMEACRPARAGHGAFGKLLPVAMFWEEPGRGIQTCCGERERAGRLRSANRAGYSAARKRPIWAFPSNHSTASSRRRWHG